MEDELRLARTNEFARRSPLQHYNVGMCTWRQYSDSYIRKNPGDLFRQRIKSCGILHEQSTHRKFIEQEMMLGNNISKQFLQMVSDSVSPIITLRITRLIRENGNDYSTE